MYNQIDIFGCEVVPKNNKRKYEVHYYIGYNHGMTEVDVYSPKQAKYLVQLEHKFKCKITDIYEIK